LPGWPSAIRILLRAAVLTFSAALSASASAASLELEIKATYLVKFGGFVVWPDSVFASPTSPLVICTAGPDPFDGALDRAASGQTVAGHPIEVRRIGAASSDAGCEMLFAGDPAGVHGPVLTVTDLPAGAAHKGIINFVIADNHVRFEIDDRAAKEHGLRISSQLLALAVGGHTHQ